MVTAPQTYYDVASDRLGEQMQRVDSLDAKAASALAFSAALLPVSGAVLALSKGARPPAAVGLYVAAMVVYIALIWFTVRAYRVTRWSLRPDIETLRANSERYDDDAMRIWVGNECSLSIAANEPRLKTKSTYTSYALGLLALDALILAVAALVSIA